MQILEAFRALRALDEDVFDLSNVKELSDFMGSDDIKDEVKVIDPEAEFEDDLQDSYIGKVIIDCCVCHSKLYKDKSEVVLDDAGELANVGEECPYCFTSDGFKVIGEVAAFGADDSTEVESEEETSDSEINDEEVNESFNINHRITEETGKRVLATSVQKGTKLAGLSGEAEIVTDKQQNGNEITYTTKTKLGQKRTYNTLATDDVEVFGADASVGETVDESISNGTAEGGFRDTAKRPGGHTNGSGTNHKALDGKNTRMVKAKDLKPGMVTDTGKITKVTDIGWHNGRPSVEVAYGGIGVGGSFASDRVEADREYQVLDESIEDLSMTANNTHLDITEDETGKVTVSMGPANSADGGEMIAPLSDETETEIMSNTAEDEEDSLEGDEEDIPAEEEIDMEIEDLDDESMNQLGEAYLKRVYENVQNYNVTGVKTHGNNLIIEGNIKFSNNSVRKSNFIFEAYSTDGKGKVTFKGRNEITGPKNGFTLTGTLKDSNLKLESLTYNYRTLTEGKSNRVYGQIRL